MSTRHTLDSHTNDCAVVSASAEGGGVPGGRLCGALRHRRGDAVDVLHQQEGRVLQPGAVLRDAVPARPAAGRRRRAGLPRRRRRVPRQRGPAGATLGRLRRAPAAGAGARTVARLPARPLRVPQEAQRHAARRGPGTRLPRLQQRRRPHETATPAPLKALPVAARRTGAGAAGRQVLVQGPPGRPGLLHAAGPGTPAPLLHAALQLEPSAVPVVALQGLRRPVRRLLPLPRLHLRLPRQLQQPNTQRNLSVPCSPILCTLPVQVCALT